MILDKEISIILEDLKAEDIVSLNVKNKSSVTDMMIIASGRSTRHVKSISDNIIKKLKKIGKLILRKNLFELRKII